MNVRAVIWDLDGVTADTGSFHYVVIEDAIKGIKAAKAAGMKCIAVANTHPQTSLAAADLVVGPLESVTVREVELLLQ